MLAIVISTEIPGQSIIKEAFGDIDYADTYCTIIDTNTVSVDMMLDEVFSIPSWVSVLLRFRDMVVKPLGLKTGKELNVGKHENYEPGNTAKFFRVYSRNENEIVMADDDKHLRFRTSVMLLKDVEHAFLYVSTIVKFNNIWGKIYFLPVKPFHKIIVKALIRKAAGRINSKH